MNVGWVINDNFLHYILSVYMFMLFLYLFVAIFFHCLPCKFLFLKSPPPWLRQCKFSLNIHPCLGHVNFRLTEAKSM